MAWREVADFGIVRFANGYLVATLPPAARTPNSITFVSDATGGLGAIVFSDGTDWIDVATGIAVVV